MEWCIILYASTTALLAGGWWGIDPDRDVKLTTSTRWWLICKPEVLMVRGEPGTSALPTGSIGFTIATDLEIWLGHLGKVLGVRGARVGCSLLTPTLPSPRDSLGEACHYCADSAHSGKFRRFWHGEVCDADLAYIQMGDPNSSACNLDHPMRGIFITSLQGLSGVNRPAGLSNFWIMTQISSLG